MARLTALLLTLALTPLFAGCVHTYAATPVPPGGPYVLPILDPLTDPRLMVVAEAETVGRSEGRGTGGAAGVHWSHGPRYVPLLLQLDTGAHRTILSRAVPAQLGLSIHRDENFGTADAAGLEATWEGTVVPRLTLGNLVLSEATLGVHAEPKWRSEPLGGLLGDEILSQQALTVDRDAGVVILGGGPLPDATAVVPTRDGRASGTLAVDGILDGHPVRLVLDTGAGAALDVKTGNGLRLAIRRDTDLTAAGIYGRWRADGVFAVSSVGLGDVEVRDVVFVPLPKWSQGGLFNRKKVGLLGTAVLNRFRYRINREAGQLEVGLHGDLVATAPERVARWGDRFPRCPDKPGCIELTVRPRPGAGTVTLRTEAPLEGPVRVLVGFTDEGGALVPDLEPVEVLIEEGPAGRETRFAHSLCPEDPAAGAVPAEVRAVVLDLNPVIGRPPQAPLLRAPLLVRDPVPPATAAAGAKGLSKEAIACRMKRARPAIQGCYGRLLEVDAKAHGRVQFDFVIDAEGKAKVAALDSNELVHPGFLQCLTAVGDQLRFPPPAGGGTVNVKHRYVFRLPEPEEKP